MNNSEQINPKLLKLVVCPKDKAELEYFEEKQILICTKCHKEYQIQNGIPILTD